MKQNKILYETKHLSMFETEKGFVYAQRRTINSIAALCFKIVDNKRYFLIRYQPLPEIEEKQKWDDCYACPITGSIEVNETPEESMIREVYEEGGIKITQENIVSKHCCIATTQMNEKVFCYLINTTDLDEEIPTNDGTIFESVSYNKWVSENEILTILKNDITLSTLSICFNLIKD